MQIKVKLKKESEEIYAETPISKWNCILGRRKRYRAVDEL